LTNLCKLLEDAAHAYPDRTAVVLDETRLTYTCLDTAANKVASLLVSRGVRRGDAVALSCPNLPYFTMIYFGILKVGAVVVPLNILLKGREVAYHLADSGAVAYFAFEGTPDLPVGVEARSGFDETDTCTTFLQIDADPATAMSWLTDQPSAFAAVASDDDDVAVILYTSGTTGQPKGAELRHRNMRDNAVIVGTLFDADPSRPDTSLCMLPLFHSYGQTCVQNSTIAFGGTIVMLPRFEAHAALAQMQTERVTMMAGVPTMYWALLRALDDGVDVEATVAHMRVATAGGSALSLETHREFREKFGVTILEGYGLSETSPTASSARFGEEPRAGSIGLPLPQVEMKLINDDWSDVPQGPEAIGEIAIKGHNVMKGYHGRPDATAEVIRDGWFRSGDLARKDEDGFYYIVGRSKEMILRGGFNVYPREIEEIFMTHPAVSQVAVIGVPHESHGEEVKAVVVLNADMVTTTAEPYEWGKARLAAYKYPRIVEVVRALPMTSTGKVLKRELR
jgi:long-chain acyl-CoA synthetase